MKSSEWKRIVGPLIQNGWGLRDALVYRKPVDQVLYGLLGEDSASGEGFYLWICRLPLFVPTDVIDLSWSERFGDPSHRYTEVDSLTHSSIAEALRAVRAEADAAQSPQLEPPGGADNVRMQEVRGYALFLDGNRAGALEVLGRVGRQKVAYPWQGEIVSRATDMRGKIQAGNDDAVRRQLQTWRVQSLEALGIEPA